MFLKNLALINYKNFTTIYFGFDTKINCFVGNNGVGKTNVLDAIYHLAFGKSYFNPVAVQNIRHNEDFFLINGEFEKEGREEKIVCSLKKGTKKVIKRNGKAYEKFSEHVGFLPLVIISPADRDLITEGSETRRKFMDGVLCQSDNAYLRDLLKYNKVLVQRNALLKYFYVNHTFDSATLSVYNDQLHGYGTAIFNKRKAFLELFIPIFVAQYAVISGKSEAVSISYDSNLSKKDMATLLEAATERDLAIQYTSVGIHKDDLDFTIDGHPIKKFGSQGQQKSFLVALKLAQFHFIKERAETTPILLLDDIFDKLDEERVSQLIALVQEDAFGQIFISDTHAERTENVIKKTNKPYKLFQLS